MDKQVDKHSYNFKKYCQIERWNSYWYQLREVLRVEPQTVLEIGVGDKVLASYLEENTSVSYVSADIAEDLQPDVVTDVENLSFGDNSFDVVCAFEVLEHLPFEKFEQALSELMRVARDRVIISLPHWGRHFSVDVRVPFFGRLSWHVKFSFRPIEHRFNGQHYWEIGKHHYPVKKIKAAMKRVGLTLIDDYIVFESPYHHFFILKK